VADLTPTAHGQRQKNAASRGRLITFTSRTPESVVHGVECPTDVLGLEVLREQSMPGEAIADEDRDIT